MDPAAPTRGRMGRIQRLPADVRALLDRLLRENVPQTEIRDELARALEAAGEPPVSYSAINRYATRAEQAGRRIREAREMADVWTAKFGERPAGEVGQHVVEILRTLAFEVALRAADGDGEGAVDPETLGSLALAVQRLERAAEIGAKRERDLRREIAAEAARAARSQGLGADTAAAIRAAIEGAA